MGRTISFVRSITKIGRGKEVDKDVCTSGMRVHCGDLGSHTKAEKKKRNVSFYLSGVFGLVTGLLSGFKR